MPQTESSADSAVGSSSEDAARLTVEVITKSLESVVAQRRTGTVNGENPVLFPNGIELIRLKFKVGSAIDIDFVLAGKGAQLPEAPLPEEASQ